MNKIITISREFGSGGREIGKRLSEQLNIPFYDSEIIKLLSQKTGLSEEYLTSTSESGICNPIKNYARSFSITSNNKNNKMEVLLAQQKIIKEIAEKGDCIIVGRGADSVLAEYNIFSIFVYANMETKIKRCLANLKAEEQLSEKEIIKKIKEVNKNRQKFHELISETTWGLKENYDLCINTSYLEIKDIITPLSMFIKSYFEETDKK